MSVGGTDLLELKLLAVVENDLKFLATAARTLAKPSLQPFHKGLPVMHLNFS